MADPAYRDSDAFDAIVAALAATGEFADVVFGSPMDATPISADRIPLAVIVPAEWSEADDADPIVNVRQVTYTLTLVVRDRDSGERYQRLDRLTSVAQNAIDGSDLNGGCLPALTKLRSGRFEKPRHPEQRVTLLGDFSYLIISQTGHSTV